MRITDLRKGDTIRCCDVEQSVEHVALHPSGTVVVMQDGATVTAEHLESNGWQLRGVRFSESRPEAALDRAVESLFALVVGEGANGIAGAHDRLVKALS